jgi:hypothetical protein
MSRQQSRSEAQFASAGLGMRTATTLREPLHPGGPRIHDKNQEIGESHEEMLKMKEPPGMFMQTKDDKISETRSGLLPENIHISR